MNAFVKFDVFFDHLFDFDVANDFVRAFVDGSFLSRGGGANGEAEGEDDVFRVCHIRSFYECKNTIKIESEGQKDIEGEKRSVINII